MTSSGMSVKFPVNKWEHIKINVIFFVCETVNVPSVLHLGKHLQYINAFPFEHDLPEDFHQELKDAVNWKKLDAPNNFQRLTTSGNNPFHSVAKQTSHLAKGEISTSFHLK